jgi:hypothetical protein
MDFFPEVLDFFGNHKHYVKVSEFWIFHCDFLHPLAGLDFHQEFW